MSPGGWKQGGLRRLGLGLVADFLLRRDLDLVAAGEGTLEVLHAATEGVTELRELARAEDEHDDEQDDDQFACTQSSAHPRVPPREVLHANTRPGGFQRGAGARMIEEM